jgi:pimeloyl-ACP methyl ester carboxylesterase
MISNTVTGRLTIRLCIAFFRYTPFIYTVLLAATYSWYGWTSARQTTAAQILWGLILAEALFFCLIYLPYMHKLNRKAVHPTPLTSVERWALFNQCIDNVQSAEAYLRSWFLGAEIKDIRRDNLRDFLLWGFFDQAREDVESNGGHSEAEARDLEEFVKRIEERLGYPLREGRGSAQCIRLTLDDIEVTYRSLTWYLVIYLVDQATHMALAWHGFKFYARGLAPTFATFPPRPQEIFTSRRSRAPQLSYWYRPHASNDCNPVVFFHGIGVGLWTYVDFLANIHAAKDIGGGQGIGVIAVEILPVSFRLTSPPLNKAEFLRQMAKILEHHQWNRFTVAAHSYGSVQTTHLLHSKSLGHMVTSVVLIDPVTVMLHLPDVAYNFTRRKPRGAYEWLLWYFASTDPGVARCLGRHFFWRENIIWKEDFEHADPVYRRKVAVCLAGRDVLVNTPSVAQYLTDLGVTGLNQARGTAENRTTDVEVLMFPHLDHAQIFDTPADCQKVIRLIRSYCGAGSAE